MNPPRKPVVQKQPSFELTTVQVGLVGCLIAFLPVHFHLNNHYGASSGQLILDVGPHHITPITGCLGWRFFQWGVLGVDDFGENWVNILTCAWDVGEPLARATNPYNPTPFAICLVLLVLARVGWWLGIREVLQQIRKPSELPPWLPGWNWGAFWLAFPWALVHRSLHWVLLASVFMSVGIQRILAIVEAWYQGELPLVVHFAVLLPMFVSFVFYGATGSRMAWVNRHWDSREDFAATQRTWSRWAWPLAPLSLIGGAVALLIASGLVMLIPVVLGFLLNLKT
jgi:hypothetical protein